MNIYQIQWPVKPISFPEDRELVVKMEKLERRLIDSLCIPWYILGCRAPLNRQITDQRESSN